MKHQLIGTGVAIVTPFKSDKTVDYEALQRLINHIIDGGVDFIVAMGTTSEAATLAKDEREAILDFVVKTNAGRRPLVVGIGGNNTAEVVQCIEETNFEAIQGILSVAPYYNKPNQRGMYAHFEAIAKASPVAVIVYNVPSRTSSNIAAETMISLAEDFSNIVAVKEASGDMGQIMEILRLKPDGFEVLSGDDALTFPMLTLGAKGVISVVANVLPGSFSDMVRTSLEGKYDEARKLHYRVLPLIDQLFADGNPAGVKEALHAKGICDNQLRLPLVAVNDGVSEKIKHLIKNES